MSCIGTVSCVGTMSCVGTVSCTWCWYYVLCWYCVLYRVLVLCPVSCVGICDQWVNETIFDYLCAVSYIQLTFSRL